MGTKVDDIVDTLLDKDARGIEDVMVAMTRQVIESLRDAGMVVEPRDTGGVWRDAGESSLPAPRLQLRWINNEHCAYELVLPLHRHDIRRAEAPSGFFAVPLGHTRVGGGGVRLTGDQVHMPYRDGCHIKWDAQILNLPMYAIHWDGATMQITEETKF